MASLKVLVLFLLPFAYSIQFLNQQEATQMDLELMGPEMGFTVDILMELAGLSCAQAVQASYPLAQHKTVLVIAGPGNNGGDGLVCARHLFHFGYDVQVFYPKQREVHPYVGLKKQCEWLGIPFVSALTLDKYSLIIDAIFGYSFKAGEIRAPFDEVLKALAQTKIPIASLDIPSGWDVEKGDASGTGLKPDFLISLTAPKLGSKDFGGRFHYIGGRFVPPQMAEKYELNLPKYPGGEQSVLVSHPFLKKWTGPYGGVPPFDKTKTEYLRLALTETLQLVKDKIHKIASNPEKPTWENTVEALERGDTGFDEVATLYSTFTSVLSDDTMQAIETEFEPKMAELSDLIYQNSDLFQRIKAVYESIGTSNFNEEQKRLITIRYQKFCQNGALVKEEQKPRLKEVNQKLATLFTQFGHHLLDEENQFVEIQESDLDGLAADFIEGARAAAQEAGSKAYYILNTRSAVEPFLTSSKRRDLREKVWKKFIQRGDNGDQNDNNAIVAEILQLRSERAKLLGYETHAHWRLEDTMAKTPENAINLMESVWKAATARVKEEVTNMQEIANAEGQGLVTIEPWDYRYYAEKVRIAQFDLDMDLVKPYFQLDRLREAMFWVAERLFGINFTQVDLPVYQQDVKVWEVKDNEGKHVGLWYFDPYARKGKKSGAWMSEYRSQQRLDANVSPIVSNNANFIPPGNPADPTLISFDDGVTLFHEFGHGLHGLLSSATYDSLAGTKVFTDYVEFPSQLLENWLTVPEVLLKFAVNQQGEPIPLALVEKIQKSMTFNKGFDTVEYLASALVDMKLHLAAATTCDIHPSTYEASILKELNMPKEIVMRHRTTQFSHLWDSDQYAACYWSYLWADSIVADAWEAFTVDGKGPFDEEVAAKLKKFVFQAGNTIHPEDGYKAFRGRAPGTEALMRKRGFATA